MARVCLEQWRKAGTQAKSLPIEDGRMGRDPGIKPNLKEMLKGA